MARQQIALPKLSSFAKNSRSIPNQPPRLPSRRPELTSGKVARFPNRRGLLMSMQSSAFKTCRPRHQPTSPLGRDLEYAILLPSLRALEVSRKKHKQTQAQERRLHRDSYPTDAY